MLEYTVIENGSLAEAIAALNKAAGEGWHLAQAVLVPCGTSWLWVLFIYRLVFEEPEGAKGDSNE
jgi:hypothetical protein